MSGTAESAVSGLARLDGVAESMEVAREACTRLRWHEGLRRRTPEAAAESRVRGATATALLEGAEPAGSQASVDVVRDLLRGAEGWTSRASDPVWRTVLAAARVTARTEGVAVAQLRAPAQLVAGLHTAAAAGLSPEHQLGRPRRPGEPTTGEEVLGPAPSAEEALARLGAVHALLGSAVAGRSPALLVASVAHAEIAVARPFVAGNGLVARALERSVLTVCGVDPTGVAVPEAGHADRAGTDYRGALAAYASGDREGVRLWLVHCSESVARAAAEGERIADAVRAGHLGTPDPAGARGGASPSG
ncbi:putative oxidoreductase [Serinicoccus hydrothermalis]|uniref:Putative oxidoreductase n=1 Tax=Serinicoccus hydrothermalis TaxID=1758689 RepID=A0A1B1NBZ5_9MICO|nr:Fic family protein [Serinicoccus hydrothermalis]ANS78895.1 putative oxidoreductase [Serinicoccus hydrothermalis]